MKKTFLIIISIILTTILSFVTYFYIWGGKPQIENFDDVSSAYEIAAELALNIYSDISPEHEHIIINISQDGITRIYHDCDYSIPQLTKEQKNAIITANKKFGYLRVSKNTVFFCKDETAYYGLVYSKNPLLALYKDELPQSGREYHRINSRWYEWGVWGI